jgi:hypothetical protein
LRFLPLQTRAVKVDFFFMGYYKIQRKESKSKNILVQALVEDCEERRAGGHSNPGPGRTYECEDVCRKGVMLGFSTMGVTVIMVGCPLGLTNLPNPAL